MPVIRLKRTARSSSSSEGMNMKTALLTAGAGLVLAVLLSSPTVAQTTPANAKPAPAPVATPAESAADVPIDELIAAATTPEDRANLLRRCAGPPPRLPKEVAKAEPAPEPA